MTDTQTDAVEVTKADKSAAEALFDYVGFVLTADHLVMALEATEQTLARHRLAAIATLEADNAKLREMLRLFPEAHDVLTRQELRDAKGNWRSLIDQQANALAAIRALKDTP